MLLVRPTFSSGVYRFSCFLYRVLVQHSFAPPLSPHLELCIIQHYDMLTCRRKKRARLPARILLIVNRFIERDVWKQTILTNSYFSSIITVSMIRKQTLQCVWFYLFHVRCILLLLRHVIDRCLSIQICYRSNKIDNISYVSACVYL